MSIIKVDTIATRTGSGNITSSNTVDLNGNELILDVDGDTSLTADTDDQIDIRIGGTDVGTLTQSSGKLTINSTGTNLSFAVGGTVELNTDGSQFYPNADNSHNLGTAGLRFKDLYLSGGVFLGATTASNKLDDYEEGTWTPTHLGGSGSASFSGLGHTYTKIGRSVHINFGMSFTSGGGALRVGGLPFAANQIAIGVGRENSSTGYGVYGRLSSGASDIYLWYMGANNNATAYQTSAGAIRFSMTYFTDA